MAIKTCYSIDEEDVATALLNGELDFILLLCACYEKQVPATCPNGSYATKKAYRDARSQLHELLRELNND
jgi:hypothetical protein